MSFASILSGPSDDQPARKPSPAPVPYSAHTPHAPPAFENRHMNPVPAPGALYAKSEPRFGVDKRMDDPRAMPATNGFAKSDSEYHAPVPRPPLRKPFPPGVTLEDVNRAASEIDQAENSDTEDPAFGPEQDRYADKSHKRSLESSRAEQIRCKVCIQHWVHFNGQ
jgi:DNA helicase INO80